MGRFYLRFFEHSTEVDWFRLDCDTLDYLVDSVFDLCEPMYHSQARFDAYEDGGELCLSYSISDKPTPIPANVLAKTIEFGWGNNRKCFNLIGDRIPIDDTYKIQITYY